MTAWTRFQDRFWEIGLASAWSWARLWCSATSTSEAPEVGHRSPHPARSTWLESVRAAFFRKAYQQLVVHGQLADLGPKPGDLVVPVVGPPALKRGLATGQEVIAPAGERG